MSRANPRTCSSRTSRVAHRPDALVAPTTAQQAAGVAQVPGPGRDEVGSMAEPAPEQGEDGLGEGEDGGLGQHPDGVDRAVVRQQRPHAVALLEAAAVVDGAALAERLEVAGGGVGDDDDPGAGQVGPPAQVDVLAVQRHALVEAVQRAEQVGPHEQGPAAHVEDVADGVVLLLVQLAGLGRRGHGSGLVDGPAHRTDAPRVVPVQELGAQDPTVGAEGLLHQVADGVGGQGHVVVAQEEERRPLHRVEHPVGRRAVPGVGALAGHPGLGQDGRHARRRVLRAGVVDDQDRQGAVGLRGEGLQHLLEPGTGVLGDHHRHHRRGGGCRQRGGRRTLLGLVGWGWDSGHDRCNLPAAPARIGYPGASAGAS